MQVSLALGRATEGAGIWARGRGAPPEPLRKRGIPTKAAFWQNIDNGKISVGNSTVLPEGSCRLDAAPSPPRGWFRPPPRSPSDFSWGICPFSACVVGGAAWETLAIVHHGRQSPTRVQPLEMNGNSSSPNHSSQVGTAAPSLKPALWVEGCSFCQQGIDICHREQTLRQKWRLENRIVPRDGLEQMFSANSYCPPNPSTAPNRRGVEPPPPWLPLRQDSVLRLH